MIAVQNLCRFQANNHLILLSNNHNLDAYCVLICVTEKYRQSLNCQAEAQYAFKLNKHIIPLIMEKGYENCKGKKSK